MNILYLIGNGFDLAQGMNTRYTDFYPVYASKFSHSLPVRKMKNLIDKDYSTWANLEKAFGEYTDELKNFTELEEVYFDIVDNLRNYLTDEQNKFLETSVKKVKIRKDLQTPEQYLPEKDKERFNEYLSKKNNENWFLHVITLNYTDTFERLTGFKGETINLDRRFVNSPYLLKNVIHLHGKLDGTILMGVNDESQIANIEFRKSEFAKDIIAKPQSNDAMKNTLNSRCEAIIKYAHLIVIYGTSMGVTDQKWWKLIGEQFKRKDFSMLYFYHGSKNVPETRQQMLNRVTFEIIEELKEKLCITDFSDEEIGNKIYIAINKPMF